MIKNSLLLSTRIVKRRSKKSRFGAKFDGFGDN